jgi:DNA ligase-4
LAERTPVHLNHGRRAALDTLQHAFNLSAINREEGLVLKSDLSPYPSVPPSVLYNSAAPSFNGQKQNHRWVKLKRDFIPNLGDCVDLVILGAGWDMDRARELRVDTSVITTFYVGVLVNQDKVKARAEAPHFEILFTVSYGPSRDELEGYNANIRGRRWGSRVYDRDDPFKRVRFSHLARSNISAAPSPSCRSQ